MSACWIHLSYGRIIPVYISGNTMDIYFNILVWNHPFGIWMEKNPVKCQKFDCCSSYFSQWTPIVLTLIYCTVKHDFLGTNFCVLNRQVFSLYMLMDHLNITYFWFYLNETTNTCMDWDVHQTVRYDIVVELLWCEQFSINMKCVKTYI
jgi:hypothetical protein